MDYPYLDTVIYDNFFEMLRGRYETNADTVALRWFEGEEIADISYAEMTKQVASVYAHLKNEGLLGHHVAIMSENRYEYIVIYLATVLNDVIVPIDREVSAETLKDLICRFDLDAVFVTDKTAKKLSNLSDDNDDNVVKERLLSLRRYNIDSDYAEIIKKQYPIEDFFEEVKDTDKERFAVLASTSGTDGRMKGVMLSQYNVITNIRGTLENNILESPTFAFLPMNHTYGFNPCILATLYNGTTLCINRDVKHLFRDIKAFNPFFFGAVPMAIESMYDGILREVKKRGKEKSFARLIKFSNFLRKHGIDMRHKFFGKIIAPNLRLVVNGGAPLRKEYVEKFDELGIMILNGYGLTECSPTIAVSRVYNNVAGSAGTIMKNIEVKIAEDGEILVKGPCVMLGYYKDAEGTASVMEDGYFKTGDIGYTDGRVIFVTGRKKNLIITENGKNVAPEYLEDKISAFEEVAECLVVPKKIRNSTVICAKVFFKENTRDSEIQFQENLRILNETLPGYMRITDYEIMSEEFEKNSSRKIIRKRYL